ncbi:MAG TPA: CoA-binding protein [Spirochaetes bacterium]|nr:CoA-binding protein [Spirochaetota bacterium]
MAENPFHLLMNPRSIAIVGAGNNPMKMGSMNALSILKDGFPGKVYLIHQREETVLGHRAYKSPAELPEAPDLAFLVVPSSQIAVLLEEFGKKGTRRVIVITAGFKELGEEGVKDEARLNEIAARYDMRFVGPNCMGIVNTALPLNTTVMPLKARNGMLGFASQSGTYVTQTLPYLEKRGIRLSKAISVGNEANINIIDALEYLGEDEQTKAIGLYIEGLRDIPRFLEVASKITPRKPVVAQYVGGSEAGARAGQSHTGAMTAPDHLYEGLFRQAGVIRVHSVEDLYMHGWALATQPPLKGNRIGILTNSGGPGTAMANECEKGGFVMPRFSEVLQEKIRPLIPPHAPRANPVDLTFSTDMDSLGVNIPAFIMESGEIDALVLHGVMRSGTIGAKYPQLAEMLNNISLEDVLKLMGPVNEKAFEVPFKYQIPMAVSSFFQREDDVTAAYQDHDIPVCDSPEKTARVMVSMLRHMKVRKRGERPPAGLPSRSKEADALLKKIIDEGRKTLDEHEAKRLLACYGVPVPPGELLKNSADVPAAVEKLGYPLVMKVCDPGILHKTERGLVRLNIPDAQEAARAFEDIRREAGSEAAVLAYRMVEGGREFMAGMTRHPGFGPAVLFGLGGIYTEAFRDFSFRVPPLTENDALEMMNEIKSSALLGAFRKMPAADMEALAALLRGLGALSLLHPEISEIDINPVIISGSKPVAVDALVVLK